MVLLRKFAALASGVGEPLPKVAKPMLALVSKLMFAS
jgi:hypothetical protein